MRLVRASSQEESRQPYLQDVPLDKLPELGYCSGASSLVTLWKHDLFALEPPADDLSTSRGVVLSRAATILRSIETQPLTGGSLRSQADGSKATPFPSISVAGPPVKKFFPCTILVRGKSFFFTCLLSPCSFSHLSPPTHQPDYPPSGHSSLSHYLFHLRLFPHLLNPHVRPVSRAKMQSITLKHSNGKKMS